MKLNGHQLQFIHLRSRDLKGELETHGGATVGYIFDDENKRFVVGVSRCSLRDRFAKSEGRNLAVARIKRCLEGQAATETEERSDWESFFLPYSSVVADVLHALKETVRPDVFDAIAPSIHSIECLSGTMINEQVVRYAINLISFTEEDILKFRRERPPRPE